MSTNLQGPTLTYNGVNMGGPYTEVRSLTGRPIFDSSERTVIYTVWTLNVHTFATVSGAGAGLDVGDELDEIRHLLLKPGGELVYSGSGFGTFGINTVKADVKWGPKPRLLSWKPTGATQTAELDWQVEVAIAECGEGVATGMPLGSRRPPLEFNYGLSVNIDQSGYSRRTYSGHVAIAQTRRSVNDRTLADHADRLRSDITPPIPAWFRRESQSYNLSEDKCRLDFTIVDVELPPNVLPPNVILGRFSHSVETQGAGLVNWTGTFTAEYEMAYNVPRGNAALHFLELVKDRLDQSKKFPGIPPITIAPGGNAAVVMGLGVAIPTRMGISEPDVYGRSVASFSLSYRMTLDTRQFASMIEAFGLFRPAPNSSNWDVWQTSMKRVGYPFHERGVAGLTFDPKDDKIIDLCLGLGSGTRLGAQNSQGGTEGVGPTSTSAIQAANSIFQRINGVGTELRPEESWLDYQNGIRIETSDDVVEQKLLPTRPMKELEPGQGKLMDSGGYRIPYVDTPQSVVQHRAKPGIYVILEGRAMRAGYSINAPEIDSIGGIKAFPANRVGVEFFETRVATNLIYPVAVASWRLRWLLPQVPSGKITPPDNPMFGKVVAADPVEKAGLLVR